MMMMTWMLMMTIMMMIMMMMTLMLMMTMMMMINIIIIVMFHCFQICWPVSFPSITIVDTLSCVISSIDHGNDAPVNVTLRPFHVNQTNYDIIFCSELSLSEYPSNNISLPFLVKKNCCCQRPLYGQKDPFQNAVGDPGGRIHIDRCINNKGLIC